MRGVVIAGALSLIGLHALELASTVRVLRSDGQGYAATLWRSSRVLQTLREQNPATVYTNEIPGVYFTAGLAACSIPVKGDYQALEEMRTALRSPGSVLVLFGRVSSEYVPEDELTEGLQETSELPMGRARVCEYRKPLVATGSTRRIWVRPRSRGPRRSRSLGPAS